MMYWLQYGSGEEYNIMHSDVRVHHATKHKGEFTGELGRLKRIEPIYPTSGRAKPKKYHIFPIRNKRG